MILLSASIQATASFILPMLSAFIAILNPFSLSESIFSIGTFVSLKNTCLVEDE